MRITDGMSKEEIEKIGQIPTIKIYKERLNSLGILNDPECAYILRWIKSYYDGDEVDFPQDRVLRIFVEGIKSGIDLELKQYLQKCKKNAESGAKSHSRKGANDSLHPQKELKPNFIN